MSAGMQTRSPLWIYVLLILLSRLPFIFSGYGSEEDAWGLILVAMNIGNSGIYEVSRFPGHPVQEYLLSLIWQWPAWILNLLTAIVSTLGVFAFMSALRNLKIANYLPAGILFAFTPVFYINSTNIMDYTWALSLVMISMMLLTQKSYLLAGIALGIACGFRITAGAMFIPFAIMLLNEKQFIKPILILGIVTVITAICCFIPVYNIYGKDFFTYYEYFPYPPMLKNIYKGTIGAWGIVGFVTIICFVLLSLKKWGSLSRDEKQKNQLVLIACLVTVLLYSYSFIKIPQKTAFVLPMVPFIIIPGAILLGKRQMNLFALVMMTAPFLFGVNLNDPLRGSESSPLAFSTTIGGNQVSFDLLNGPLPADIQKRELKINYAKGITEKLTTVREKTLLIAGWWQNELNYFCLKNPNPHVKIVYYIDEPGMQKAKTEGAKIYFLPEQDFYNDLRYNSSFTNNYAEAFR